MPNPDFQVPKLSLAYSKIVPNPRGDSWSQVYNAGSLFAVLALALTVPEKTEISLPAIGKKIFNDLEAEFFSLQEKNLHTIQSAIKKSLENTEPDTDIDACIAYVKNNILYLFIAGKGKAIMKRDNKLGTLLYKKQTAPEILSTSGYLKPGDTILLQTDRFTRNIPSNIIKQALELQLPSDIAESLSPHVHQKEDGGQAAIIITYNGGGEAPIIPEKKQDITPPEAKSEDSIEETQIPHSAPKKFYLKLPKLHLTRIQKISTTIAIIIIIALTASIAVTKSNQENTQNQTRYRQILSNAQKNYDQGKELKKLNQSLAREDFLKAKQELEKNINSFQPGTPEHTGLQQLLNQTENELNGTSPGTPIKKLTPKAIELEKNTLLSIQKNNKALAVAQDNTSVYMLTSKSVTTIDKTTNEKKEILTNDNDWTSPVSISPYLGNLYILDKKNSLLKFIAAENGFGKTQYFKDAAPVSKAQSLAIDGSIWILTQDGKILKYTSGQSDDFAISGLNNPMKNPTNIYTNTQTENLYVLDNGNARILKFSKSGQFQNQYSADILLDAKNFDINESEQKAIILSNNKFWELPL